MPTYEFRCPQGHEFEKFYRTISGAEAQAACPTCGQISERMMSAAGFSFKGSGFYLTDYGKNAHRDRGTPAPASSDGAKAEGGKSEGGKSEGAKSEGGSGDAGAGGASAGADAAKPAAEAKPAPAPAKKSPAE